MEKYETAFMCNFDADGIRLYLYYEYSVAHNRNSKQYTAHFWTIEQSMLLNEKSIHL